MVKKKQFLQQSIRTIMSDSKSNRNHIIKCVCLIALTLQAAVLALSMRHARVRVEKKDLFFSSTAVIMAEFTKLVSCLLIVFFFEEKASPTNLFKALHNRIVNNKIDTLKMCCPSLLYVIQNNLLYLAAQNLDAATYQICTLFTIITSAFFTILILRRRLLSTQWAALYFLLAGIASIQFNDQKSASATNATHQNRSIGVIAALMACTLSGLAGVYLEKMLKGADISVWMRNLQMSMLSIPLAIGTCLVVDLRVIQSEGFFHGYDSYVVYLFVFNACGGLITGLVFKYADNILKGFATSCSIIVGCIASVYLFDFKLTIQFGIGVMIVIGSIYLYSHVPKPLEIEPLDTPLESKEMERQPDPVIIENANEDNGIYVIRL